MMRRRPARSGEAAEVSALCLRSKAHQGYDATFLAACREALALSADTLEIAADPRTEVFFCAWVRCAPARLPRDRYRDGSGRACCWITMPLPQDDEIAAVLTYLALRRGAGKTFCPSEAARALAPSGWRDLMPAVRRVAADLPLRATQKGVPVDPLAARGPIRLGLAPKAQDPD